MIAREEREEVWTDAYKRSIDGSFSRQSRWYGKVHSKQRQRNYGPVQSACRSGAKGRRWIQGVMRSIRQAKNEPAGKLAGFCSSNRPLFHNPCNKIVPFPYGFTKGRQLVE